MTCRRQTTPSSPPLPPQHDIYRALGLDQNLTYVALQAHDSTLRTRHSFKLRRNVGLIVAVAALGSFFHAPDAKGRAFDAASTAFAVAYTGQAQRRVKRAQQATQRSLKALPQATAKDDDFRLNLSIMQERIAAPWVRPARPIGALFDRMFCTPAGCDLKLNAK